MNTRQKERNLDAKELVNHKFESMKWSCRDGVSTFFASYRIGSAALRDLSIHLLWPCSNAPNNTPFLFYSARLSLCRVAQQNYAPNNNYQSKLWSKKIQAGEIAYQDIKQEQHLQTKCRGGRKGRFRTPESHDDCQQTSRDWGWWRHLEVSLQAFVKK